MSEPAPDRILFYRERDPWGFLSNFAPSPIELGGRRWPTTEHYFQAQKFAGTPDEERVRAAPGPGEAARLGRSLAGLRPDWESVKDAVMLEALRAKFSQHAGLRRRLLETGAAELVEHTRNDRYWADGGDGSGRNRLGERTPRSPFVVSPSTGSGQACRTTNGRHQRTRAVRLTRPAAAAWVSTACRPGAGSRRAPSTARP